MSGTQISWRYIYLTANHLFFLSLNKYEHGKTELIRSSGRYTPVQQIVKLSETIRSHLTFIYYHSDISFQEWQYSFGCTVPVSYLTIGRPFKDFIHLTIVYVWYLMHVSSVSLRNVMRVRAVRKCTVIMVDTRSACTYLLYTRVHKTI